MPSSTPWLRCATGSSLCFRDKVPDDDMLNPFSRRDRLVLALLVVGLVAIGLAVAASAGEECKLIVYGGLVQPDEPRTTCDPPWAPSPLVTITPEEAPPASPWPADPDPDPSADPIPDGGGDGGPPLGSYPASSRPTRPSVAASHQTGSPPIPFEA